MITITDSAAERFNAMCSTSTVLLPRIEIVSGGCNGFEKRFSFDIAREDDVEFKLSNGSIVLIDLHTFSILDNSVVDYKTTLTGSFFSIEIPEAQSSCGCGASFSL